MTVGINRISYPSKISKQCNITWCTVYDTMLKLEKLGLIITEKKMGRKVRKIYLTPKGNEIYSYLNKIYCIIGEEL